MNPSDSPQYRDLSFLGFPGYRVGDDGSVWSCRVHCKRGDGKGRGSASCVGTVWKKLKPTLVGKYYSVRPLGKSIRVHHLVLLAFVGPRPPGMLARHFPDRTPTNNSLANLSWGTNSQNQMDRVTHGTDMRGEKHFATTLTDDIVRQIRQEHAAGLSCRQLGKKHQIHYATAARIVRRESWAHVT